MTTPLTTEQLHDELISLPAGTLAVLDTLAWRIPALRRDFDGRPTVSLDAAIWRPDADGDPSGYLSEFGPIFTESPDVVVFGLVRAGSTITHGEVHARDDDFGWRQVHTEVVADAIAGDLVYFGNPRTPFADLTVMLALEGGSWAASGCTYYPLDDTDAGEPLPEVTAVSATAALPLDWHESRQFGSTVPAR